MLQAGQRREDFLLSHKDKVKCTHCGGTGYTEVEKPKPSPYYPRYVAHPDGRDEKKLVNTPEEHAAYHPEDHAALQAEIAKG